MTGNDDVFGTWALVRTEAVATDGDQMPAPYGGPAAMGRLTLAANGRMIAVICDGRTGLADDAAREYISYCGAFTFDGKQLITTVDAAADQGRLGSKQIRQVDFEDDLMVLRPPAKSYGGKPEQRVLYWRRIAAE
ncbi:MAG: lipocalin-like domain-containing protein [Rhodospirillaceae bacterium]